jgi:hypothetical protein
MTQRISVAGFITGPAGTLLAIIAGKENISDFKKAANRHFYPLVEELEFNVDVPGAVFGPPSEWDNALTSAARAAWEKSGRSLFA